MSEATLPCTVVGAGSLGTTLARRLHACGFRVDTIVSRTESNARMLASEVGATVAGADLSLIPSDARVIFLCVPDAAIELLARRLAGLRESWSGTFVFHTSGALTNAALESLTDRGAWTAGFHPVQTFTRHALPGVFEGICIGVEGEGPGAERAAAIARRIGALPLTIRSDQKVRYHLAASMLSNFTVVLAGIAGEILASIGIEGPEARRLYIPLLRATLDNLETTSPGEALSGPVVRGDAPTVGHHLDALREHFEGILPVYRVLALAAVRLSERSGRLAPEGAEILRNLLESPQLSA